MTIPDDTTAKLSRMVFGCLLVGVLCLPAVGEELTPQQRCAQIVHSEATAGDVLDDFAACMGEPGAAQATEIGPDWWCWTTCVDVCWDLEGADYFACWNECVDDCSFMGPKQPDRSGQLHAFADELTPRQQCNIGCYVECADEEGSLDIACVNACKVREDCDNLPGGTTALPWLVGESRPTTVTKCEARAKALHEAKVITEGQKDDAIAACHGWDTRKLPEGNEVACVLDDGSPFGVQDGPDGFDTHEPGPLTMLALYLSRVVL